MAPESTITAPAARRAARWAVAAIAVAAGLILAGCSVEVGTGNDLDTGDVESAIADGYRADGNVEVDVSCPDDVEAEEGGTFECTVTGPTGATADIEVRQTDDEGNVRWNVVPVGLNAAALEAQIAAEFQRQRNVTVSVDCPSAIAAEEGNVFSCTVTAPNGDEAEAEVTQEDDEGNVRWRIV
jgi:hypothetical protein